MDTEAKFKQLFGRVELTDHERETIRTASRLAEAGPGVALAAIMLGMTNLPEPDQGDILDTPPLGDKDDILDNPAVT